MTYAKHRDNIMTTKEKKPNPNKGSLFHYRLKTVIRYSFLGKEVQTNGLISKRTKNHLEVHSSSATVPDKIYESEGVDNEITGNSLKARSR